jgi:hypothetical protein
VNVKLQGEEFSGYFEALKAKKEEKEEKVQEMQEK